MNEKLRIGLVTVVWIAIFVVVIVLGVNVLTNTPFPQEVANESDEPTLAIEQALPGSVGLDANHLRYISDIVEQHIAMGTIEGAVVAIVRNDKLAYIEPFGYREDGGEAMTTATHFDLASLTKPVVTATAIMQLVERGVLSLDQRVSSVVSEFEEYRDPQSREVVYTTIGDLMSHMSGIRPYIAIENLRKEYPEAVELNDSLLIDYIAHAERLAPPRTEYRYSCLNYILLGEIVERCSGLALDEYAAVNIFEPLNMSHTRYTPDSDYAALTAPTSPAGEVEELRGVVHDPLAREVMAGVSGNAGLFSTADDLAIYAAMLLNGGEWGGRRILTPMAVEMLFVRPCEEYMRTLAWEQLLPQVASAEENLAGVESTTTYTHTGATGTSIVLDRENDMAIIILTNRTHAGGSAEGIASLRRSVRTIATYARMDV